MLRVNGLADRTKCSARSGQSPARAWCSRCGAMLLRLRRTGSGAAARSRASPSMSRPPSPTRSTERGRRADDRSSSSIPGMAGRDPGATSVSGQVIEKDLTLALARELRDDLVKRGRVRVAMTSNDDRYLTLDERAAVARRLDAGCSSRCTWTARPIRLRAAPRVYSLSDVASDAEAAQLAAKENAGATARRRSALSRRCFPTLRCGRK